MDKKFKILKSYIDKIVKNLEKEAVDNGQDITALDFQDLVLEVKKKILAKKGISLEEYEQMENESESSKKEVDYLAEKLKGFNEADLDNIKNIISDRALELEKKLKSVSDDIYSVIRNFKFEDLKDKPRILSDKDVKIAVEKYGLKEKDIKQISNLWDYFKFANEQIDSVKKEISKKGKIDLSDYLKKDELDKLNLDFLKKDALEGLTKITVSKGQPSSPKEGDLWVDIS